MYVPNCDAYRSSLSLKIHPATFWTPHTAKQRISLRISCQRAPSFIPLRDGSVTDFLTPPAPIQGLCHAAGTRPVERPPLRPWRCWGRSLSTFPARRTKTSRALKTSAPSAMRRRRSDMRSSSCSCVLATPSLGSGREAQRSETSRTSRLSGACKLKTKRYARCESGRNARPHDTSSPSTKSMSKRSKAVLRNF